MNDRLRNPKNGSVARKVKPAKDAPKPAFVMPRAVIKEPALIRELITERQRLGIDKYDEVWDGVYVVPPLANNPHQFIVADLTAILIAVIKLEGRGEVQPGANVSDCREQWEKSFRCPDVVVVLKDGLAIDCNTHWLGGPDFLVEVQSPGEDTEEKIPFYGKIGVRELLVIHRDTRRLRLYRHDGRDLTLADESDSGHTEVLTSKVVPLKFRWKGTKEGPRTVVQRTDGKRKSWTI